MQGVEVIEQRRLDVLLHFRHVGGILGDHLGVDLDVPVRRGGDIELGGEQSAHVEVRADRPKRALTRHRTHVGTVGYDDDGHDTRYLDTREVGMHERKRLCTLDGRRLHGERLEILTGHGPTPALDGLRSALLGLQEGLFVASAGCRKQVGDIGGIEAIDRGGNRLDCAGRHIARTSTTEPVFAGHDVGTRVCGVGHWDGAVDAVSEPNFACGAVEHIIVRTGPRPEKIIDRLPRFEAFALVNFELQRAGEDRSRGQLENLVWTPVAAAEDFVADCLRLLR